MQGCFLLHCHLLSLVRIYVFAIEFFIDDRLFAFISFGFFGTNLCWRWKNDFCSCLWYFSLVILDAIQTRSLFLSLFFVIIIQIWFSFNVQFIEVILLHF